MTAEKITPEQKEALEKDEKKKAAVKRAKKGVDYVRKDLRPGIYSNGNIRKKFQIRDRQHYVTHKQSEIDIFDADIEIMEFNSGTPHKKRD